MRSRMPRSLALLIPILLAAGRTASAAEIPFDFPPDLSVGAAAYAARLGDLDGDGDLDAVYSRAATGTFIQLNTTGLGSFGAATNIGAASGYHGVDLGDVDGDGRLDVLVATGSADQVLWYRNLGAGSFDSSRTITATLDQAETLATADVDRDGDLDVVSASSALGDVYWYRNDGTPLDGGWTSHAVDTTGLTTPFDVTLGDVNRDGRPDVAVADKGADSVYWYENDGTPETGTWTRRTVSSAADGVHFVRTGDFDRDGNLDIVFGDFDGADIRWSGNDGTPGNGGWIDYTIRDNSGTSQYTTSVFPVDLDRDGDLDVVSGTDRDGAGTRLFWYENDGSGTNVPWTQFEVAQYGGGNGGFSAVAGDIDGDGDLDLLYSVVDNGIVAWLLNQTVHRSALFPAGSDVETGTTDPRSLAAGDFDADGDDDLAVGSFGSGVVRWHANTGSGASFSAGQAIDASAPGAEHLASVDLDRDGDLDLLASSKGDDRLVWHENRIRQSLAWSEHLLDDTIGDPDEAIALDVNGDGDLDVLAGTGTTSGPLRLYSNAGLAFTGSSIDTGAESRGLAAADIDGDGDLDLLVANETTGTDRIDWYRNDDGAGTSWTRLAIRQGNNMSPNSLDAADVDGDGDLDVVACSSGAKDVTWHANDGTPGGAGDWSMTEVGSDPLGTDVVNCQRVRALDFDADGDVDIAAWGHNPGSTWLFLNTAGDGSAWTARETTPGGGYEGAVADLDHDGRLDLLGVRPTPEQVRWLPDLGGQFALPTAPIAYQGMVEGRSRQVLYINYLHQGRAGDSDAELAAIELRLEDGDGIPLSSAQADALFSQIQIRRDSATGTVIAAAAAPFTLSAGVLTLAFTDTNSDAQIAAASARPLYAMATLGASASSASPNQFQIVHLTQSSSSAEDASADLPLSLEFEEETSSGVIQALSPTGDADSDGLANAAEADTQLTDPLDTDTDDDGLSDGAEVNTHGSNPLAKDSDEDGLLDGAEVALGTSLVDPDSDDDLICDGPTQVPLICTLPGTDNCPLVSNAAQTNGDALPSGDLCQCGDLSGDGPVTATDYARARELVVGRTPGGPADADRCDVTGDSACTVEDLAVLERFLASAPVTVETRCDAWFGP